MIPPPRFTNYQLEEARRIATENFRLSRMEEPLEDYLEAFDEYLSIAEELLEQTVDLTALEQQALAILTDPRLLDAFRYLAAPPISLDDLKIVASVASVNPKRLQSDPAAVRRIIEAVQIGLDRRRFPWIAEGRDAEEPERKAALLASAALMATSRVGTNRRSTVKVEQEERVESALLGVGLKKVRTRTIHTLSDAPNPGEFCRETLLGPRKADFVVRLFDHRVLGIECKVSNSATNSVKRLNNDAAAKAEVWRTEFGERGVVSAAVLSGVYKLHNLVAAQDHGLTLFWAHALDALTSWILATSGDGSTVLENRPI